MLLTEFDKPQKSIARFSWDENSGSNKITLVALNNWKGDLNAFLIEGKYILGLKNKKIYMNNGGKEFLETLRIFFTGTMLRAGAIVYNEQS